ncbi:AMP-binding protein [Rhodococcus hoagii]|nr:AMP-binding protein [Prescottella equi]
MPIDPSHPEQRRRNLLDGAASASGDGLAVPALHVGQHRRPEGVAVTHGGLSTLVDVQRRELDVTPEAVVLQAATPTFDACVFELLAAHAHGATLVCAPASIYAGTDLQGLVEREGVTHVNLTPTVLATLDPAAFSRSLTVVSAGEVLSERTVAAWAGHRLYNGYGPTECTVGATLVRSLTAGRSPSDYRWRARPFGFSTRDCGPCHRCRRELYVGGAGLARGYHGAPRGNGGKVRGGPVRPGCAPLPDRRPRPGAGGRLRRVRGTQRRSGTDQRGASGTVRSRRGPRRRPVDPYVGHRADPAVER